MKAIAKAEELALKGYVTVRSLLNARGQGSLEYVAIAVAIVIVIALAFGFFRDPILQQTSCIIDSIDGGDKNPQSFAGGPACSS